MSRAAKSQPLPWYAEGLRFACTGCGACCRGEGYVWVDETQIARLAAHLGLEREDFDRRYLRRVDGRLALTDGADLACVFWDEGCTVYEARPTQCRTFPFWRDNLASEAAWDAVAEESPGVNNGRLYDHQQIESLSAGEGAASREPNKSATDADESKGER